MQASVGTALLWALFSLLAVGVSAIDLSDICLQATGKPGYLLLVDGLELCVRRQDNMQSYDLSRNMTTQWVSNTTCEGQVIFEVTNIGRNVGVPASGIVSNLQVVIGTTTGLAPDTSTDAYLEVPPSFAYYTTAVNRTTGPITLQHVGYYTAPGSSFTFAITIACWKGKDAFSGDPANCPCPAGSLPQYFTLMDGTMGTPNSASACQNPAAPDTLVSTSFDGNVLNGVELFSSMCFSRPALVPYGALGTPEFAVKKTWDDGYGNCYEQNWFQVTNMGNNVIKTNVAGPINVHLGNRFFAQPNNSGYTTFAGSEFEITDFDIFSIGYEIAPGNTTYFSLITYCKNYCPCFGDLSIAFAGPAPGWELSPITPATVTGVTMHVDDVSTPELECLLPQDTSIQMDWAPSELYTPTCFLTGGYIQKTGLFNSSELTYENFFYTSKPRVKFSGFQPGWALSFFVFNQVALTSMLGTALSGTLFIPPACDYILGIDTVTAAAIAAAQLGACRGTPFDMTLSTNARAIPTSRKLLYSLQLRYGACQPGSPSNCTSFTACVGSAADGTAVCTNVGGDSVDEYIPTVPVMLSTAEYITNITLYMDAVSSMDIVGMNFSTSVWGGAAWLPGRSYVLGITDNSTGLTLSSFAVTPPSDSSVVGWFNGTASGGDFGHVCALNPVWITLPNTTTANGTLPDLRVACPGCTPGATGSVQGCANWPTICTNNSECCSNNCNGGVCSMSCTMAGAACNASADCCSGTCTSGSCTASTSTTTCTISGGTPCNDDSNCCGVTGSCPTQGLYPYQCCTGSAIGGLCSNDAGCCSNNCNGGTCASCLPAYTTCVSTDKCCSGNPCDTLNKICPCLDAGNPCGSSTECCVGLTCPTSGLRKCCYPDDTNNVPNGPCCSGYYDLAAGKCAPAPSSG